MVVQYGHDTSQRGQSGPAIWPVIATPPFEVLTVDIYWYHPYILPAPPSELTGMVHGDHWNLLEGFPGKNRRILWHGSLQENLPENSNSLPGTLAMRCQ